MPPPAALKATGCLRRGGPLHDGLGARSAWVPDLSPNSNHTDLSDARSILVGTGGTGGTGPRITAVCCSGRCRPDTPASEVFGTASLPERYRLRRVFAADPERRERARQSMANGGRKAWRLGARPAPASLATAKALSGYLAGGATTSTRLRPFSSACVTAVVAWRGVAGSAAASARGRVLRELPARLAGQPALHKLG
jgi:hypothetical protein